MALKNVVIGYAKGDKGDKGDTGERGATGQTGPQGESGNIADAAITDTQGLDVAKGAKTAAQKLFDAIADRIVNKLVTNDTLTTKLADYLLKSAMSSTNINSTTNVPTSALVYSLLQDVNNNLSNAGIPTVKKITDLYAIKKSGFYCYDAGASNAPMSSRGGMIVANYLSDSWISLTVVPYALSKIYTNTKYNNMWVGWAESATKDDLPIIGKFTNKKNKDIIKIGSVVKSRSVVCVFPRYNTLTTVRCIYPSLEISAGEDQFQLFAWDTNTQNDSTSTNLDGYYIVMPMLSK